ncbi:hypothetical protein H4S02_002200 [Coemansia sp. RSA 2611]|nr:hypothetical protein LPJ70_002236 [Coemansia sp. RSA 2708]KAJ2389781.1 hypothetical protein H4S02_002200 [Coemansia sp. RSA 2611]KAJ2724159.1 hypothetical protein H4R23_004283 [Coemansia sp. Cherry 401B]
MDGYSSRDPEWKKEFVRHIQRECGITKERFPLMALSTVDLDGRPAVRMVSPRGFVGDSFLRISKHDQGQYTSDVLTFCTHAQSNKVAELVNTSEVQLVCWLPNVRVQIRCSGHAHLLFHPENPSYSTLSLDIRHRVWPRDGTDAESQERREEKHNAELAGGPVDLANEHVAIDAEFIREQAYLHHSPVIQAWYSWPAPGRVRLADPALYPPSLPQISDPAEADRFEANARRNYVLMFIDVNKVDIFNLDQSSRVLYSRRGDTSWSITEVNP